MSQHDLSQTSLTCNDDISHMPSITDKKIFMGYWHNWSEGIGAQHGRCAELNLVDIPKEYNVVAVSFMKGIGIPTFKPYNMSDMEFRRQIRQLNKQGQVVLISLGGPGIHIELKKEMENDVVNEIIRLVDVYGFNGLDTNIEQNTLSAADNIAVLSSALKTVRNHYLKKGKHFIISITPKFIDLRKGSQHDKTIKYEKYILELEGYYDFIAPQFFNRGGDGLWVSEANHGQGEWFRQSDDTEKENFLYYMIESIIFGVRDYVKIPIDKFVIGLPSNVDAANSGHVNDPYIIKEVLRRLSIKTNGKEIKGLMTWSINWDFGKNKDDHSYNGMFLKSYVPLIYANMQHSEENTPTKHKKPEFPQNVILEKVSITFAWDAAPSSHPIKYYKLYRDGICIAQTMSNTFEDSALEANTRYNYFITTTNHKNIESVPSTIHSISTGGEIKTEKICYLEWEINHFYKNGMRVTYKNNQYLCIQTHPSHVAWSPQEAYTLWKKITD